MNSLEDWRSKYLAGPKLGEVIPNIASLLVLNAERFPNKIVFREKTAEGWIGPTWPALVARICTIANRLTGEFGLKAGDKFAIVSQNRLDMLELELAVMACGGIAVPIFPFYPQTTLPELLDFCDARFVAVQGQVQLDRMEPSTKIEHLFTFDDASDTRFPDLKPFSELTRGFMPDIRVLAIDADPQEVCLMQYTSGTTAKRKLVQLTHGNILSQQAALDMVWDLNEYDRMLSYLPWHHSFGGIFELFNALYRGTTMSLEPSYGKDPNSILESWKSVQPTVFFSVPKVYQALVDLTRGKPENKEILFHHGLKFVFTAAAPMPDYIAREFDERDIRIIEGWGLTETSPCCTITGARSKRQAGIVGHPIPGVELRIANDGEIQVHGPNVMKGYYNNDEANADAFTVDGWFRTGDIGEILPTGLKLIGRNDRIFKLSNGEKIVSADVEKALQSACHFLTFAVVEGSGQSFPIALVFPNRSLMTSEGAPAEKQLESGAVKTCNCPRSINDLAQCLKACLMEANAGIEAKFARVPYAVLIDDELSIERGTLTPSMKVIAKNVHNAYNEAIDEVYMREPADLPRGEDYIPIRENIFVVPLNT